MKIIHDEIVSNTDIIKNYKGCREKTKALGKTFIFKNNVPDMILMDVEEYKNTIERLYMIFENLEHIEIYNMVKEREKNDNGKRYSLEELEKEILNK